MTKLEQLEQQAVEAAINFQWEKAIEINKEILSLDKKNLSANLRIGYAYLQLQKFDLAKRHYRKVLQIEPGNNLAKDNWERIKILETKHSKKKIMTSTNLDPNVFLEIPGKTKNVTVVNLGQKNTLAQLSVGQEVFLRTKKRKVEVRTKNNDYVGTLPDDLSKRLLLFLRAKSEYSVYIKEANLGRITVFIREKKKGKKVAQYLSFPHNIQAHLNEIQTEKDSDDDYEEISSADLERLAESLAAEEKDYIPYQPEKEEEETED